MENKKFEIKAVKHIVFGISSQFSELNCSL